MPRKLGNTTVMVLNAVAAGVNYGFDIMDETGLPSGTVYPALGRLENMGYVRTSWEDQRRAHREKRPPRRYYTITRAGRVALHEASDRLKEIQSAITQAAAARTGHAR